jgi:large subunit ribosomal protein L4
MAAVLKALKLDRTTCLVGTAKHDPMVYKSARNIPGVEVAPASQFNAYTILKKKRLLLTKAALEELRKGAPRPAVPESVPQA